MTNTIGGGVLRDMSESALQSAASNPGIFAASSGMSVSDAIAAIIREQKLRKSHKIWRK